MDWRPVTGCSNLTLSLQEGSQDPYNCTIKNLDRNTPYLVRVRDACSMPFTDDVATQASLAFWTLPAEWDVHVGQSMHVSMLIDVWEPPIRCQAMDYFTKAPVRETSECYAGDRLKHQVTITRTDIVAGWGVEVYLYCVALSVAAHTTIPVVKAASPSLLEVRDATSSMAHVDWQLTGDVGTCACYTPHVQMQAGTFAGPGDAIMRGERNDPFPERGWNSIGYSCVNQSSRCVLL